MKRFHCTCGQEVFFEDKICRACGASLGFSPTTLEMLSIPENKAAKLWTNNQKTVLRACALRNHPVGCNWLVPLNTEEKQCISCRLTRTIPAQNIPINVQRWAILEQAKRRLMYSLLTLKLPIVGRKQDPIAGLTFDFLEDQRTNPLVKKAYIATGHKKGTITLNVAEADDTHLVRTRIKMNERYRTVLGHLRHEIGHYYWDKLIRNSPWYPRFRHLFGGEENYRQALDYYYTYGPIPNWEKRHISAYASSHPWEDWAETWAHYLHIMDTLETATSFGVIKHPPSTDVSGFHLLMQEWRQLTIMMNSLNRSMGLADAYPFTLTPQVTVKLRFIHQLITESEGM